MKAGPEPERGTVLFVGLHHKNLRITVRELVRRGYRVRVLGSLGKSRLLSEEDGVDRSPIELPSKPPRFLPKETRRVLMKMDRDCVLLVTSAGRSRTKHVLLAGRVRSVPVVLNYQTERYWEPDNASVPMRARIAVSRLLRLVQWSVHRSPAYTTTRGPGHAVRRTDLSFIPHAVEPVLEEPPPLPEGPLRVLSVTQCKSGKNNPGLVSIAALCRDENIDFTVVFSCDDGCKRCRGSGPADFRAEIAAAGIERLDVLSSRPEITDLYRTHHIIVRNSFDEGSNYTLIEGAAEGCIPIGSRGCGGAHGYLEDGRTGYVIPGSDDARYAQVLTHLSREPELRERMREASLRFAKANCAPGVLADFLEGHVAGIA